MFSLVFSAKPSCNQNISNCCAMDGSGGTISQYYMNASIDGSGSNSSCIDVSDNNLSLDMSGYEISGFNGSGGGIAISIPDVSNISIYNGSFSNNYYSISAYKNTLNIENLLFSDLYFENYTSVAIHLYGSVNSIINNCTFYNLSGNEKSLESMSNTNLTLSNSSVNYSKGGFYFSNDIGLVVENNNYADECKNAIVLDNLANSTVYVNVSNSYTGLDVTDSDYENTTIIGNISDTFYSIYFDGFTTYLKTENVYSNLNLSNLYADNKPVKKYLDSAGLSINLSDYSIVFLKNVSNSSITGSMEFSGNFLTIYDSNNISVSSMILNYSKYPISILNSSNISISSSVIGSDDYPIYGGAMLENSINVTFNRDSFSYILYAVGSSPNSPVCNQVLINNSNFSSSLINESVDSNSLGGVYFLVDSNLTISNNNFGSSAFSVFPSNISDRNSNPYWFDGTSTSIVTTPDCSNDKDIYRGSTAILLYRVTDSSIISNTFDGIPIAMNINGSTINAISSNLLNNVTEGVFLYNSDVNLSSNHFSSTMLNNIYQSSSDCSKHLQFRSEDSTFGFNSNYLSGKRYSLFYSGQNISLNGSVMPTSSSPYKTSLSQLINISEVPSSQSLNLTYHYSDNVPTIVESSLRSYKYNGTWANVNDLTGTTCSINQSSNQFVCSNISSFSIFGLFAQLYVAPSSGDEDSSSSNPLLILSSTTNCDTNNIIWSVKDDSGNSISGSIIFIYKKVGDSYSNPIIKRLLGSSLSFGAENNMDYKAKVVKSDYSESYYDYVSLSCSTTLVSCEISSDVNCSSGLITFSISNDNCNYSLSEDYDHENLSLSTGSKYVFRFMNYSEYSFLFNSDENKIVDTSSCAPTKSGLKLTSRTSCDFDLNKETNNTLILYASDELGGCVEKPYTLSYNGREYSQNNLPDCLSSIPIQFIEDGTYSFVLSKNGYEDVSLEVNSDCGNHLGDFVVRTYADCNEGILRAMIYDDSNGNLVIPYSIKSDLGNYEVDSNSLILDDKDNRVVKIPFSENGTYSLFISKFGYNGYSKRVRISCGFDDKHPPENTTLIVLNEKGDKVEMSEGYSSLSPGNYTVILADSDGNVLATELKEILEKPNASDEDDLLYQLLSEKNKGIVLFILLLLVAIYLYLRRRGRIKAKYASSKHSKKKYHHRR